MQWVQRALSQGMNQPKRVADHSLVPSVRVNSERICTSTHMASWRAEVQVYCTYIRQSVCLLLFFSPGWHQWSRIFVSVICTFKNSRCRCAFRVNWQTYIGIIQRRSSSFYRNISGVVITVLIDAARELTACCIHCEEGCYPSRGPILSVVVRMHLTILTTSVTIVDHQPATHYYRQWFS